MGETAPFYWLEGPLAPGPTFRQTRSSHLQGFAALLRRGGLDPAAALERHDIDPGALRSLDSYVGCLQLMDTIEFCTGALDAPLFGLDLARCQPQLLGFVGSLCRVAPDLKTALECLRDYLPVMHSPECRMSIRIARSTSEIECGSWLDLAGREQITYGAVMTLVQLLASLVGTRLRPRYVLLRPRPGPAEVEQLEREYGCKVIIGQSCNAVGLDTDDLTLVPVSADRVSFQLLHDYAESVRNEQRRSLLARVQDFIRGSLADHCDLARCASALGLNPRKLQLQLEGHGVSFTQLLARQREGMARAWLAADAMDIDEVALRLGYADQTSFGRAFRRWTGSSPGAFKSKRTPGSPPADLIARAPHNPKRCE